MTKLRMSDVALLTILGVALSGDVSAAAQGIPMAGSNLITNPDFDKGAAGWTPLWFTETDTDAKSKGWSASVKWAPDRDFEGHRESGSLELALTAAEGRCAWAMQCIVVGPGTYEMTGEVFVHATDVHTEGARVSAEVFWVDRSDCRSSTMRLTRWSLDATGADAGRWTRIVDPTTFELGPGQVNHSYGATQGRTGLISVPAGARGAQLRISACVSGQSTSPETVIADFDHLNLRATPLRSHVPAGHP